MSQLFPDKALLAIFAAAAILSAVFVSQFNKTDLGLSAMAIPLFIVAALLGMRRNTQLSNLRKPMDQPAPAESKLAD